MSARVSAEAFVAALARLAEAGLDLQGRLADADWDALVPEAQRTAQLLPGARGALVLGGGRAFLARHSAAGPEQDAIDGATEALLEREARALGGVAVFAHRPVAGAFADFVALGRAAGLGWPSRLGLLLHPERGPWIHLRGALLLPFEVGQGDGRLAGDGPCPACPAPCSMACPGAAPGPAGFDVARCGATRRTEPGCEHRCDARHACPLGTAHAYGDAEEARLMALSLPAITP